MKREYEVTFAAEYRITVWAETREEAATQATKYAESYVFALDDEVVLRIEPDDLVVDMIEEV